MFEVLNRRVQFDEHFSDEDLIESIRKELLKEIRKSIKEDEK
jgi:hypothetical protein